MQFPLYVRFYFACKFALFQETAFTQPPLLLFTESIVCTFIMYNLTGGWRPKVGKARSIRKRSVTQIGKHLQAYRAQTD